jgi:hypothetical protein
MITTTMSPTIILAEIYTYLHEGNTPAELRDPDSDNPWTVEAAAFVDNVQVNIQAQVFRSDQNDVSSAVVFNHMNGNDVVRFHRVVIGFHKHAISRSIGVSDLSTSLSPLAVYCEDDFADYDFELELREPVESLLAQLEDSGSTARLEAVQLLASWVEVKPDCRLCVAEALRARPGFFLRILQTMPKAPLCESYPMTAALKFIAGCPEAAKVIHGPLMPTLLGLARQQLPKLVEKQVALAIGALFKRGLDRTDSESTASTRCKGSSSGDDELNNLLDTYSGIGSKVDSFGEPRQLKKTSATDISFGCMPSSVAKLCEISSKIWE